MFRKTEKKPENILVDYTENSSGNVSAFECHLADWGTAGDKHPGGTPMYAGPRSYEGEAKDLFSFGRLVLELFLLPQGK